MGQGPNVCTSTSSPNVKPLDYTALEKAPTVRFVSRQATRQLSLGCTSQLTPQLDLEHYVTDIVHVSI